MGGAPQRLVIGARPGRLAALRARVRARALRVEVLSRLDALSVLSRDTGALARALRDDPDASWIEPDRTLRVSADGDEVDPATGRALAWADDAVDAGPAIAAAGGGAPSAPVAVIDTGVDLGHPDLSGRVVSAMDATGADGTVRDATGHGTFVTGLIGMVDGNGIGGRGVAGTTPLIAVRASLDGTFLDSAVAAGIVWAVDHGARVLNMSFAGPAPSAVVTEALDYAYDRDVVMVAAAGNSGLAGDPPEYPAAQLGGRQGAPGMGLSVAATRPDGAMASFSTRNDNVSIAAPGAGDATCSRDGVFSTLPTGISTIWDGAPCARLFGAAGAVGGRWAYGDGTSFSAPLVAGAAALVRQVNPGLSAVQTADVLLRAARPLDGGWNPRSGAGLLDAGAATALAARFDTAPPTAVVAARPGAGTTRITVSGVDRTLPGRDPAPGPLSFALERSPDGARWTTLVPSTTAPIRVRLSGKASAGRWYRGTVCDGNLNCATAVVGPVTVSRVRAGAAGRPLARAGGGRTRCRPALALAARPALRVRRIAACVRPDRLLSTGAHRRTASRNTARRAMRS
jgi:subtilisin family serine protease